MTAYDSEVPVPVKDVCKDGGRQTYDFTSQRLFAPGRQVAT